MRFAERFMVKPGESIDLGKIDPRLVPGVPERQAAKAETAEDAKAIDKLQDRLFAEGTRALLIVLQGMDTSGKDGTVRGVFNACGPIGVAVTPFKAPGEEERQHDFLWRVHKAVPRAGLIGIFNRSHYEDVLVAKVKALASPDAIERRYGEINAFEAHLSANGTHILKFMLHISKDEQAERLQARVDEPDKRWKFNPGDLEDRKLWADYMAAYEVMLARCSTVHAPWHIIPADRKWARNWIIARITREAIEEMNPQYPQVQGFDPKTIKVT